MQSEKRRLRTTCTATRVMNQTLASVQKVFNKIHKTERVILNITNIKYLRLLAQTVSLLSGPYSNDVCFVLNVH